MDSEIFEKLAEIRGISKDEMKDEILWALEKAVFEKSIGEIMAANPGMNRETAKELALFRLELKKEKKSKKKIIILADILIAMSNKFRTSCRTRCC